MQDICYDLAIALRNNFEFNKKDRGQIASEFRQSIEKDDYKAVERDMVNYIRRIKFSGREVSTNLTR